MPAYEEYKAMSTLLGIRYAWLAVMLPSLRPWLDNGPNCDAMNEVGGWNILSLDVSMDCGG